MKRILARIMLVVVANACFAQTTESMPTPGLKQSTVILHPTTKSNLKRAPVTIIFDQYYSPYSGSSFNTALFEEYKILDDYYLHDSNGKINFAWGMGRLGKVFAETCLSSFLMIDQHEIFGHGYRGREFGFFYLGYKIGVGSGWTSFIPSDYNVLSFPERASFATGGVEATTILSQQIRNNWFLSNQIDRRDAIFYLLSALDQPSYIFGTDDSYYIYDGTLSTSNDILLYIQNVNSWYGKNVLSLDSLQNKTFWNLLDPTLYYSVYSIGTYIFESSAYTNMYTFNIKGFKYLPTPRLILSPWGPEFQIQNNIVTPKQQLLQVNLRYGKTSFIKSYGLDVLMNPIYKYKGFTFGNKLYVWNQPQFLKQNTATGIKNSFGIADYISAEHKIYKNFSGYGEFGYKTAGFIQGNPLGNSWIWRLGIMIRV